MSENVKKGLVSGAGLLALGAMVAVIWVFVVAPLRGQATAPSREIVLEARGVAFNETNPTLELRPGETVRVVIRNDDPGVLHSITIPGLMDRVLHVPSGGQASFTVTVPASGGFEYVCPQHAPKMKGRIVIHDDRRTARSASTTSPGRPNM